MEEISPAELESFLRSPGVIKNTHQKNLARAIALYFALLDRRELVLTANSFRETALEKSRQSLNLNKFIVVDPRHVAVLKDHKIINAMQLLKAVKTRSARFLLSQQACIPYPALLEMVKLADLMHNSEQGDHLNGACRSPNSEYADQ